MRVLLYHKETGLYFRNANNWVADVEMAEDFGSSRTAALFAEREGLGKVEVLLDFNDPEYNVYLPVDRVLNYLAEHAAREAAPSGGFDLRISQATTAATA
jgi:hypothetical protein